MTIKKCKYGVGNHPNSRNSSHLFVKGHPYYGGEGAKKTQFKKGNNVNLGREFTEETKKKIGRAFKGKKLSEEHKEKISKSNKKISHKGHFKKGIVPWNKGIEFTQMKGENHPAWQGGISYEPYGLEFHNRFKELIRERDNNCCLICNILGEELKEKLSIHHMDYNKKNSFPQNCVSLCRCCHTKTNINRNHWKTFFQSLLKERYSYEYTQDQKIILDFNKNKSSGGG